MAVLTNKLHIAKNGVVHDITSYSTQAEGTPLTITGGNFLKIKNNGVDAYIGLWPTSVSGGTLHSHLTIEKDGKEYWVEKYVNNNVIVTINQSENQTIKVNCNNTNYTSNFSILYGTSYTATITASTGYNPGTIKPSTSGTFTSNTTIYATPATKKQITITITQSPNQTITVTANGVAHTSTFTVDYGTTWTATISGATGYTPGTLNKTSGTATSNTTISATAATTSNYTITITQSANQTITVTANGVAHTSSFTAPHGTTWTASISPSTGYNAGSLSPGTSGTLTGNITVKAGAASLKTYTLKLNGTSNQVITLKYKNRNSANTGYETEVTKTSTSSTQSFTVRHGTTWTASITSVNEGYNKGTISVASGTVTAATTVSATAATLKTYTLKLNGTSNQVITLKYKNRNSANTGYETEVTKTSTSSAQSFTVRHGTTWTATLAANTGYTKGTLSASSGTVTAATIVSATAATINTYTVTVNIPTNAVIKVNNVTATSSNRVFTFNYGTSVTINAVPNTGFNISKIEVS